MDQQEEIKAIRFEPDSVYIRMYVDANQNLSSELWLHTDSTSSYELVALVRGMLARLDIDQQELIEVGEYIINKEAKSIEQMITKGNA